MRVLYVINGMGTGGAERSLFEAGPRLAEYGIDIRLACLFVKDEGVEDRVTDAGMELTFLRADGWTSRICSLRTLIGRTCPDVVHTTILEANLAGRLASIGARVPVLTTLVNTSYTPTRRFDPNVAAWKLYAARMVDATSGRLLTDHFHAISQAVKRAAVRDLWVAPEAITVIPRGRDESRLGTPDLDRRRGAREHLGIGPDQPLVLAVGRQEFQKGHRYLLEAAARLLPRRGDARFLIAGREGNATTQLRERHRELDLGGRVRFLGHREDIGDLLAAADLFVFPSLYEGLGGALLEAMAMHVPAVVSDVPALREVTREGRGGLLVPPADPEALAAGIRHLLDHPTRRGELAQAGREIFEDHYRIDDIVAQMATLYSRVARSD